MSYPYGLKGAPAVGGGLGGLPKRSDWASTDPLAGLVYSAIAFYGTTVNASGVASKPEKAKYMRVTAIGGGGNGNGVSGAWGGGGGACAGSGIVPVDRVTYTAGGTAKDSTASWSGWNMFAGAGKGASSGTTGGLGGTASGGLVNFTGGNGGYGAVGQAPAGGGGSAGPNGNGGHGQGSIFSAGSPNGEFSGVGYGPGGGVGGFFCANGSSAPYLASNGGSPGSASPTRIHVAGTGFIISPVGKALRGDIWDFVGATEPWSGAVGSGGCAINSYASVNGSAGAVVIEYWSER